MVSSAGDAAAQARSDRVSRWDQSRSREEEKGREESGSRQEGQKSRMPKELKEYIEATRRELQESAEKMEKSMDMKGIPLGYQSAVKALEERQKQEERKAQDETERPLNTSLTEVENKEGQIAEGEFRDLEAAEGQAEEQRTLERTDPVQMQLENPIQHFHQPEPWNDQRDPRYGARVPPPRHYDEPWRNQEPPIYGRPPETGWRDDSRYSDHRAYYDDYGRGRAYEYDQSRPQYVDPRDHQDRDRPPYRGPPPPRRARYDDYDDRFDDRPRY